MFIRIFFAMTISFKPPNVSKKRLLLNMAYLPIGILCSHHHAQ